MTIQISLLVFIYARKNELFLKYFFLSFFKKNLHNKKIIYIFVSYQ